MYCSLYKNVTNGIVEKSNTWKEVTSKMFTVTMQSLYQVTQTEFKIRYASQINIILNIPKRTIICHRTSNMSQWDDNRGLNNNLSGIVTLCGLFLKKQKPIWFQNIATQLYSACRSMTARITECQRSPYTVGLKFGPSKRYNNHTKLCCTLQDKILHIPRSEENFFRLQQEPYCQTVWLYDGTI
jgi:hypothetical protein